MKVQFDETEGWKILRTIMQVISIAIAIWLAIVLYISLGFGDAKAEREYETMYVMCMDYVNVRSSPNKKQDPIGRFETGDTVTTDGQRRNGYIHCVDLLFEDSEGWVFAGYLTYDKPEKMNRKATIASNGRLAARKYVNGKRTRWLKPNAELTVWYWSDDWALTNCGYVQSKYLELE